MGAGMSVVPLVKAYIRRTFVSAGLCSKSFAIDGDTTIHCWISKSLLLNNDPNSSSSSKDGRRRRLPILVLIHGFGPSSMLQWRHQVGPLSRHFSLVIPDLLFFGSSTTTSPLRSELFQAESIAKLLLTSLPIAAADDPFDVVGTSYGGFVAYHVAMICGDRVRRVVIASSDLLKGEEDDCLLRERAQVDSVVDLMLPTTTAALRKLMGLAVYRPPAFLPEFLLRDALRNMYGDNMKEKAELIKGITLGDKDKFQLTPLPQEVLIIWGDHDRIFPLEKAFEIQKRLGEKARMEIVKNTSHVPNTEDPDKFNEALLNFLLDAPKSLM